MRKLILFLFFIPALVHANLNPCLTTNSNGLFFISERPIDKAVFAPEQLLKKKLPRAFYPWGVAATAVIVGGGLAYYGSYKDILPLAITGGTIAIAGGALAVISLSPFRKIVGLGGIIKKTSNTMVALSPMGIFLSYGF